jgi:hypothetical protein
MKVDLATLWRGDEAVILKEGLYHPVGRSLMDLDVTLPLTEHIFELTMGGAKGFMDCRRHFVVPSARHRIVVDVDVSGSGYG